VAPGAVNVGWNEAVSLKQLLAQIGELLGGLPAVTHLDGRPGDIRHSRADNRRLIEHYRLPVQTSLRDGLAALLNS